MEKVKSLPFEYLFGIKEQREHKVKAKYAYPGMADYV